MSVKKVSNLYNNIFKFGCKVACKLFNASCSTTTEFNNQINSGKGMLIFCNHLSSLDFLFTSQSIIDKNVACVVADNMKFSNKFLSRAINKLNTIYKKQYYPDFSCIKKIKEYIENGISVVICPEGKVSSEGITSKITPTTGKLVKLLQCPVGVILVQGAGLTRPKWAYTVRFGKVESHAKLLLNSNEIDMLSVSEINEKIQDSLYNNEYEYQRINNIKYHGAKYAEGLERVLYKCPKCGHEFCLKTDNNILKCNNCGNTVKYTTSGELQPINEGKTFTNIGEWVEYEKTSIRKDIIDNKINQEYEVWLFKGNEETHSYDYISDGTLSYNGTSISFKSHSDHINEIIKLNFNVSYMTSKKKRLKHPKKVENKYQNMIFNIKHVQSIANIPGDTIDLINEYGTFRFMFYEKYASTKLVYFIEEFNTK